METLDLTTDIQPVTEFRSNTSEMLESLKKNRRTIILTQHGRPAAVLESVEEYQRKLEELRFMKGLVAGLRDIESGQVVEGEDFFKSLKSRIADGK
ncbi:MAG: type II toxin-antitoxin system Phd/YefM family antitoxin [Desulfotomaculaceae bacterium]|nr:type II toxin-antitoxin system Phd/YefM family antitoxin [Desulfotomaculaceae bacterium]